MLVPDGDLSTVNGDVKCPATPAEEKDMLLGIIEASAVSGPRTLTAAEVKEGDKFYLVTSRYSHIFL